MVTLAPALHQPATRQRPLGLPPQASREWGDPCPPLLLCFSAHPLNLARTCRPTLLAFLPFHLNLSPLEFPPLSLRRTPFCPAFPSQASSASNPRQLGRASTLPLSASHSLLRLRTGRRCLASFARAWSQSTKQIPAPLIASQDLFSPAQMPTLTSAFHQFIPLPTPLLFKTEAAFQLPATGMLLPPTARRCPHATPRRPSPVWSGLLWSIPCNSWPHHAPMFPSRFHPWLRRHCPIIASLFLHTIATSAFQASSRPIVCVTASSAGCCPRAAAARLAGPGKQRAPACRDGGEQAGTAGSTCGGAGH